MYLSDCSNNSAIQVICIIFRAKSTVKKKALCTRTLLLVIYPGVNRTLMADGKARISKNLCYSWLVSLSSGIRNF